MCVSIIWAIFWTLRLTRAETASLWPNLCSYRLTFRIRDLRKHHNNGRSLTKAKRRDRSKRRRRHVKCEGFEKYLVGVPLSEGLVFGSGVLERDRDRDLKLSTAGPSIISISKPKPRRPPLGGRQSHFCLRVYLYRFA